MAMLPLLRLLSGEMLVSYMARLAKTRANTSLRGFLGLVGMRQDRLLTPDTATLERIESLSGAERRILNEAAVLPLEARMRQYRAERFSAAFHLDRTLSFCPTCLLEDDASSEGGGRRIGLQAWAFEPFRTCPRHNIPLIRRPAQGVAAFIDLLEGRVWMDSELAALSAASEPRAPSALQTYVAKRFDGAAGPEWLTRWRIDQITACATLLGACLLHTTKVKMTVLVEDQLDEAGAFGFGLLMHGKNGVLAGLGEILAKAHQKRRQVSPSTAFGALYRNVERDPDLFAPLGPILREHILENMPVAAGTMLLGETVDTRRRHNVHSLAQMEGLSQARLKHALRFHNLLQAEEDGGLQCHQVFDAVTGEAIAHRLKNAIPMKAIPERFNCDATTAAMLVAEGHAARIGGNASDGIRRPTTMDLVDPTSLDRLMADLVARATLPLSEIAHPIDMSEAAYKLHWPVDRILRMVLSSELTRIALHPVRTGFTSIMADEWELTRMLYASPFAPCIAKSEGARILEVDRATIDRLLRTPAPNGAPLVRRVKPIRGKGLNIWHLEVDSFVPFCGEHLALVRAAKDRSVCPRALARELSSRGIEPVLRAQQVEFSLYSRSDI